MMAINKAGIASVATGILFLGLTAVACYAHYAIQHLALPIPAALSFLVIVLPVAQALSTWYLTRPPAAARRGFLALPVSSPPPPRDANNATPAPRTTATRLTLLHTLAVLTAVLATLSGTYTAPGPSLDCALREQWQALYRAKDGEQLRTIQDALRCCGFRSVYDMAWPFPTQEGGRTQRSTCAATYGRGDACAEAWRGRERALAGGLVAVCVGGWVCQMVVTTGVLSWMRRFVKGGSSGQDGRDGGGERAVRAIGFPDEERYTDDPAEDLEDGERGQMADDREGVLIDGPRDTSDQQHHTLFPSAHGNGEIENEWGRGQ